MHELLDDCLARWLDGDVTGVRCILDSLNPCQAAWIAAYMMEVCYAPHIPSGRQAGDWVRWLKTNAE